jgi:ATP-binding cassette subfamily B protein
MSGRGGGGGRSLLAGPQGATHEDERIFEKVGGGRGLTRFFAYLHPYRRGIVVISFAIFLATLGQVALPMAIRQAVNSAIGLSAMPLSHAILIFIALAGSNAAFGYLQEYHATQLAQRVVLDLRSAMFAHLQRVSLSFLDRTQTGRLMSRLQGDVGTLQEFLEQSISSLGDVLLLIGIIAVLLTMNWRVGGMTLLVLPVLFIARLRWQPWAQRRFRRARDASSTVNAALAENINGIRTVQESRREDLNFAQYTRKVEDNFQAAMSASRAAQSIVPAVDILTGIAMATIILASSGAVVHGRLGAGEMVAFFFYVQRFFDPIRSLSMQYTVASRAAVAAQRIFEILDVNLDVQDKPDALPLPDVPPAISFRHVSFGYIPGQPVLHDVSFEVKPNQTVALVGPTGSGKSSIAALLHRFYDVWSGEIRIAGVDVRDVTQDSLGHNIAMVLQEPFLFSATVFENIRYNTVDATDEQIIAAARTVRAHDFITELPDGYNTVLGQAGRNLSIGQRQLISFARALLANPRILILDEATASIDSFTEREIQEALTVLRQGRTSIIIAHRLATIRDADLILVLNRGRIVEQGDHAQLVAQNGLYAKLHRSSQASFDDLVIAP